jgi:putative methionine-R-sulfoxide reductase with GAF domain
VNTSAQNQSQIQFRHSLQARLLIAFVLITFIPLVGFQIVSAVQSSNSLATENRKGFSNIAINEATYITAWGVERMQDIKTLAAMREIQTFDQQSAEILDRYKAAWGIYETIAVFNPQGITVFNSDHKTIDASDRQYVKDALAGNETVSDPLISKATGHVVIFFAVPLISDGKTVGVVMGNVAFSDIGSILQQVDLGKTGEAYLIDKNGFLVTPPKYEDYLKATGAITDTALLRYKVDTFASRKILADKSEQIQVTQYTDYRGKSVVGAYTWLPSLHLGLIMEEEQAELLTPVIQNATLSTGLVIVLLVILGVIGILLAQALTRPITHLTTVATRISGGDLTAQARVEGTDEIGALATTFNSMTTQLRNTIGNLEQRVAERTKAIEASAEVSRRLSTITDTQQLILAVVEEVQQAFNYYHAHIYLFDAARENLVLAGGTGEAGRIMLSRGHQMLRGKGLVGRAAETNHAVLVPDTASDPGWLPNPLLPDTRAEVAVPIAMGEQVLGVLDVQHNVVNGLQPADAELLRGIASQVAIALQNTRAYAQTRQAARRETLINTISQKIQSAATVEEVLQVAIKELGQALDAQRASAQLGGLSAVTQAERSPAALDHPGGSV